ncbi:MAG: signal peptidase II [Firmicutes bacterium]|nr:signal peptidase II [Bacillota bacterium]
MFFIVSLLTFLIDQASKIFIMKTIVQGQSFPVIANVFHITYIHNPGAAFGLMANRTSFFIAVSLLVIAGIIIFYKKSRARTGIMPAAMGLIAGGALGNLFDRIRFGEVIDFIDLRVWPVFNLADSAIVIGAGLFMIALWRAERRD